MGRGLLEVVRGEVGQQLPDEGEAGAVVVDREVGDPERTLWVMAPPSSSLVTSSWVTVLITSGPVTNMYAVSFTMTLKSVMAGL